MRGIASSYVNGAPSAIASGLVELPPALRRLRHKELPVENEFLACCSPPKLRKSAVAAQSGDSHGETAHIHPSTSLLHSHSTLEQEELAFHRAVNERFADGSGEDVSEIETDLLDDFLNLEGGNADEFMFPFPFDNTGNGPGRGCSASGAAGPGFPVNYRAVPLGAEIRELPGSEISSLKSSTHSRSSRSGNDDFDLDHSDVELELDRDASVTRYNWGKTNQRVAKTHHDVSSEEPLLAESRRYFIPIPRTKSEDQYDDLFGIAQLNDGFPGENINDNGQQIYGPNEDVFDLNPVDPSASFYCPAVPDTLAATVSRCSSSKHHLVQRKKPRTVSIVSIDQASIDTLFFSHDGEKKEDATAFDSVISPRRKIRTAVNTKCAATTTKIVAPTPIRLHGYDHAQFNTNIRELESGAEHQIDQPCSDIATNATHDFQNIVYSEYHRMVHSIQCDSPTNRSTFGESALKSGDV